MSHINFRQVHLFKTFSGPHQLESPTTPFASVECLRLIAVVYGRELKVVVPLQVRSALSEEARKEGIFDTPETMFNFFIERVRSNLHIILCMSPVGDPFRYVFIIGLLLCVFISERTLYRSYSAVECNL